MFRRGSVAQTFLATMISFFFFAFVFHEMPFRSPSLNLLKICSELQLFVILLVCLILQVEAKGMVGEIITLDGYGTLLIALTLSIFPVTLYIISIKVKEIKTTRSEETSEEAPKYENPMNSDETE